MRHHEPGDLYETLSVKFPETIDPAAFPLLEQALPPRKPVDKVAKGVLTEEVVLAEPDVRRRPDRHHSHDDMDEDHDEPRVQCANQ